MKNKNNSQEVIGSSLHLACKKHPKFNLKNGTKVLAKAIMKKKWMGETFHQPYWVIQKSYQDHRRFIFASQSGVNCHSDSKIELLHSRFPN